MLQNLEFIQGFVEEAKGHIETVESELLKMDVNAVDAESINNIFRAVHSVKGTAGFFNLTKIVELSHSMENIFGEFRSGKKHINSNMVDLLLSANDSLKSMTEDVINSENTDISDFVDKLSKIFSPSQQESVKSKTESGILKIDRNDEGIMLSETQRNSFISDLKRGCHFYKLLRRLNEDFASNSSNASQFIRKIKSVGNLIDCHTDVSGTGGANGDDDGDIVFTFLCTTVLDIDLFADAIDINPECICELHPDVDAAIPVAFGTDSQAGDTGAKENVQGVQTENTNKEANAEKNQNIAVEDSVRVHVTLLNNLLNLASEMVLGRNQLMLAMENHRKSITGIEPILQNIDHITTDLQEKIMQTRMQPIGNVFNKFPRIIRELSKKLKKEIELKMEGVDVELDKSIIEALGDPLTHLVRNAADHGLETPEERQKAGKSRGGTVIMKAYHEGGYVNIDIIDDGKGIDVERIKQKALEKDFISKADASSMVEQEILRLLFKPGFSTAEKITDVSGRGVGMDVVKTNIDKLGGTIEIFTVPDKGTTFRLLLPLTLAIIPSLIVEVENQRFALPQVNLQEIVRIKPGDASRKIEYINNAEVLRLRGRLLPVVHLADVLGIKRTYVDPATGERKKEKRKLLFSHKQIIHTVPGEEKDLRSQDFLDVVRILVIKIGSRRLGIAVNKIHASEQILVKPLPVHIKNCICYSGVTILGDGKTVMILDPGGIIEKANLRFVEGADEKKLTELAYENERIREQQNLLIFKCSGPETLAIDLSMVSRVEEINSEDIESIGDKEYIKFRGDTLRVIRPEDFLPLNNQKTKTDKLYVIIPKLVKRKIGIVIEKIHDTVQTGISLKQDDITAKGFIGSTILNNKIVLLLNIYELFEKADPENFEVKSSIKSGDTVTILLVEDTPFFQKLEKSYLEDAGFNVLLAQHGMEAFEILQEHRVDAVVSDISMPVMDGLELIKRIRGDARFADLPVIAVTSLTGELQVRKGLEAGFDAYEFKLDRIRLVEILEEVLQKRRKAI